MKKDRKFQSQMRKNVKEMMYNSLRLYKSNIAFTIKHKKDKKVEYENITYKNYDNGHFTVTMRTGVNEQFYGWLCTFGNKAKVIEPKEQIDELLAFMQGKETALAEKTVILPEYRRNMKEKIGEYSFDDYEEKVKAVAILLLQLNADMLTDEQRAKFGIEAFKVVDELEV